MFGYKSMVWASAAITFLGFTVWLHHFFTMGSGGDVNGFFGVATMLISIPTGVKLFNWLFTIYKGRLRFSTPILWTLGFMVTFTIGGMTGVLLAIPGADFLLHNSLFLIAHFHNTIIGGAVFGYLAGFAFWFPKAFGFTLDEKWGKRSFWCWLVGFYMAFMPLYILGFMGMTRRLNHYDNPLWKPYLVVAFFGAVLIFCGIACQLIQLFVSVRNRKQLADVNGDPWEGRTLEWATSSPPPFYNFAELPKVQDVDAFHDMKKAGTAYRKLPAYQPIHMPKNTAAGFFHRRVRLRLRLRRHLAYLVAHGGRLRRHDRLLHRAQLQPGRRLLRPARRDREDRKRPFPATRQAGLNHVDGSIEQASGRRPRSGPRPRSCTR